jgi:hypothetical protein
MALHIKQTTHIVNLWTLWTLIFEQWILISNPPILNILNKNNWKINSNKKSYLQTTWNLNAQ